MAEYEINVGEDPQYGNVMWNDSITMEDEEANGACTILYALFGESSNYVNVFNKTDGIEVDYAGVARSPDILLVQGENVNAINTGNWIIELRRLAPVTKQYTLKILTLIDAYVVQFDKLEFLNGMIMVLQSIGLDPTNYFYDFYQKGNRMAIDIPTVQNEVIAITTA